MLLEAISNFNTRSSTENKGKGQKLLIYYISVIVFIVFISIYQNIHPLFEKFTHELRLNFFSLGWIFFTLGGFLLTYGFIKHQSIPQLIEWEQGQEKPLESKDAGIFEVNKKQPLTFLFIALNAVLLFITVLDINYLYLGSGLPEGITHKQFVHNGVGMLIFSILLGISIILYAFRGNLNFDRGNTLLKFMVYGWLIQNLLMVMSTVMRNHLYICEALLTYKRIGVYYWLALAATGLLVTLIKIHKIKRNWYLLRSTSFVAYLLLIVSCPFDWDQLISNYNISRIKDIAGLDKKYLISLSEGNLKQLYLMKYHPKFEIDSAYHYEYNSQPTNKMDLDRKLFYFLDANQSKGWRSFNFRTQHVMQDINSLNKNGTLDILDLTKVYADSLTCLLPITNLKDLRLSTPFPGIEAFEKIYQFKNLQTLRLDGFYVRDTVKIKILKTIKTLYLNTYSPNDSTTLSNLKLPYKIIVSRKVSSN